MHCPRLAPGVALPAGVGAARVEAEPGCGGGARAGVAALRVRANTTLVDVPTPLPSSPARVA